MKLFIITIVTNINIILNSVKTSRNFGLGMSTLGKCMSGHAFAKTHTKSMSS